MSDYDRDVPDRIPKKDAEGNAGDLAQARHDTPTDSRRLEGG
jgi:hypothetical protein